MVDLLAATDLAISRAGAHIVYELMALGKPAIFVPLSWAYKNEQLNNALVLVKAGSSVIAPEQALSGELLLKKIENCFTKIKTLTKNAQKAKSLITPNAAEKMVFFIEKEL
jgi:UDP-N-acetylglucosamine--N-acetylmuramyl-(pentapeptide) pyrophosphoryl-undecaprenol N-acetylglucosamine transferase